MAFKAMFQAFRGGGLKFIDITTNFRLFYSKKNVTKFFWSPNLESYLQMRMENNIGGGDCFLINTVICGLRQFT